MSKANNCMHLGKAGQLGVKISCPQLQLTSSSAVYISISLSRSCVFDGAEAEPCWKPTKRLFTLRAFLKGIMQGLYPFHHCIVEYIKNLKR